MTISVIIPVYNVADYLDKCVGGVVSQTYKDLEIILVNDGSTDTSGELCNIWRERDARVRVIHKENGGVSDARNVGVGAASGEYILFLDSDDFWDDDGAIERLVRRVEKTRADVINYSYKKCDENGSSEPYFQDINDMPLGLSVAEQLKFMEIKGLYIASPCNKMIKRSLFDDTLLFRKGVYAEDIEWCAVLLKKGLSMDFVCENFYCYCQRTGSRSHLYGDKNCGDLADNILHCMDFIDEAEDHIRSLLVSYTAYQYSTFFLVQAKAKRKQKELIAILRKYKWVLAHHGGKKKVKILYWCCKLIGYRGTCWLLRLLYTLKR